MRYQLFIFDFDGTLADSGPQMIELFNIAAARFGFKQLSRDEIETLRGRDNREILRELGVPMWRLPQIAAFVRKAALDAPSPALFAGVPEMLRALRDAGATLALVSSNSEAAVRRALGADADVIHVYACEASLFGKAAKFKRVLKETRIAANQAIGIGDETRDIEAARKAGIACGAVIWGYATEDLLRAHKPDEVFTTPADVVALTQSVLSEYREQPRAI